jgi:hypothetical protein
MLRTWRSRGRVAAAGVVGLVLGLASGTTARAQFGIIGGPVTGTPTGSGTPAAAFANPLMNPYMNPLINPYATQQVTTPGNAALYLFAAQSMYTGIGSGRISGVRPGPGGSKANGRDKDAGPASAHRSASNTPGGNAARFFGRSQPAPAARASYYDRQARYFPQTGK